MKKIIIVSILSMGFIVLTVLIFFIGGIVVDLFNLLLKSSIFSWFYNMYGIEFEWNIWNYFLLLIGSGYASYSCVSALYRKILNLL